MPRVLLWLKRRHAVEFAMPELGMLCLPLSEDAIFAWRLVVILPRCCWHG